jgi:type VI secretion system protein ImpB
MSSSGQKLIGRNRAPRVQIEYEVEVYGAQKKVQLPFVMGVMSDLLGTPEQPPAKLDDRKFVEVTQDNFDERLKAMKPRAVLTVDNTLTGNGKLPLALTFESIEDFSPAAIARKVEPLRELLEARAQLSNLIAYMDGKGEAEALLSQMLKQPGELKQLAETLGLGRKQGTASEPATPETKES